MFERFAQSARTVIDDSRYEAARRGDRRIGTEHMLLALVSDESVAQAVGIDAIVARQVVEQLDQAALAAVGLEFGTFPATAPAVLGRHVPLTRGAKAVLEDTLAIAAGERARAITARHMMRALLQRQETDPAAMLLDALQIDRQSVSERLKESASADS